MEKSIQNETPKEPTIDQKFDQLPIDGVIELPFSKINPSDVDDGKCSYTTGPIEVYRDPKFGKIYILDGNHRYFQKELDLIMEKGYENVDRDKETITTRKVVKDVPW